MTISKKEWKCPQCNSTKPPKAYHCPDCKIHFDANYNPVEPMHPSYHMGGKDEASEYMGDKNL